MLAEPFGVAPGGAMFLLGERRFRDECTQTGVVGLVDQADELLVGDLQVVAQGPELIAHGTESPFDLASGHGRSIRRGRPPAGASGHDIGQSGVMARPLASLALVAILLGACGNDGEAGSACTELREPEDPASVQHVVGATGFVYQSNPPTSGPHVGIAAPAGVQDGPLQPAVQVRILEQGAALVQYDPAVVDSAQVEGFADLGAVVAPAADLPAPITVTAWTWKLTCSTIDEERIATFVEERPAGAPGAD